MACLLHEKPFAGVNGSGKHLNFSLASRSLGNLLDPGDNPHANAQFLVFCAAVIRAVHRHAKLLRAVVAHAGNDHRLGANEAPPAILSVFLGDELTKVFEQIRSGDGPKSVKRGHLQVGVDVLPPLPRDAGDRNRTSPFAFTGNRFEFRAVGSNQSIAGPLVALNTIIAESLDEIATKLERATGGDAGKLNEAVQTVLQEVLNENWAVIFNGDNYAAAWHEEAERRGLPNLRTTVDALPTLLEKGVAAMFEKYKGLTTRELESRYEIYLEQYCKTVTMEATLTLKIGRTICWPAAIRYQRELAVTCTNLKAVGYTFDTKTLDRITALVRDLQDSLTELEELMQVEGEGAANRARHCCEKLVPAIAKVRQYADELEGRVSDDIWPLPTYQEMLFIK